MNLDRIDPKNGFFGGIVRYIDKAERTLGFTEDEFIEVNAYVYELKQSAYMEERDAYPALFGSIRNEDEFDFFVKHLTDAVTNPVNRLAVYSLTFNHYDFTSRALWFVDNQEDNFGDRKTWEMFSEQNSFIEEFGWKTALRATSLMDLWNAEAADPAHYDPADFDYDQARFIASCLTTHPDSLVTVKQFYAAGMVDYDVVSKALDSGIDAYLFLSAAA